jgi:hypothetical protein
MNLLMDFCDQFGYWDYGPPQYSDNILPGMEKRMLKAGKVVKVLIKDGWIDSIIEADSVPDVE